MEPPHPVVDKFAGGSYLRQSTPHRLMGLNLGPLPWNKYLPWALCEVLLSS